MNDITVVIDWPKDEEKIKEIHRRYNDCIAQIILEKLRSKKDLDEFVRRLTED